MSEPMVLATANAHKVTEIAAILVGYELLPRPSDIGEIEEDGDTLEDNARIKARVIADATQQPALADDTGLEVDALDGAPGVHSARYAGENVTFEQNVNKLLHALEGVPADKRTARFRTVALLRYPDRHEVIGVGSVEGFITDAPRSGGGFGYDPVFVPAEGDGRTLSQMTLEEKNEISHRGRAFRHLMQQLS